MLRQLGACPGGLLRRTYPPSGYYVDWLLEKTPRWQQPAPLSSNRPINPRTVFAIGAQAIAAATCGGRYLAPVAVAHRVLLRVSSPTIRRRLFDQTFRTRDTIPALFGGHMRWFSGADDRETVCGSL